MTEEDRTTGGVTVDEVIEDILKSKGYSIKKNVTASVTTLLCISQGGVCKKQRKAVYSP